MAQLINLPKRLDKVDHITGHFHVQTSEGPLSKYLSKAALDVAQAAAPKLFQEKKTEQPLASGMREVKLALRAQEAVERVMAYTNKKADELKEQWTDRQGVDHKRVYQTVIDGILFGKSPSTRPMLNGARSSHFFKRQVDEGVLSSDSFNNKTSEITEAENDKIKKIAESIRSDQLATEEVISEEFKQLQKILGGEFESLQQALSDNTQTILTGIEESEATSEERHKELIDKLQHFKDAQDQLLALVKPLDSTPLIESLIAKGDEVSNKIDGLSDKLDSLAPLAATATPGELIEAIKEHYVSEGFTRLPRQSASADRYDTELGESFINLVLVKQQEQLKKEQAALKAKAVQGGATISARDVQLSSFEAILQPKEPIALTKILPVGLTTSSEQATRHVLIEGRAGIGKTTLSKYLAHQWALGEAGKLNDASWSQFGLVILVPLRELLSDSTGVSSVEAFIHQHYLSDALANQWRVEDVKSQLAALEQKELVLYILDGYDEVEHLAKASELWELWRKPFWVLTSRPYFAKESVLKAYRHLENIGFLESDIKCYIQNYFSAIDNNDQAGELIDTVFANPNLKAISSIPINLEWLCALSGQKPLSQTATLTTVYQQLVVFRAEQHAKRERIPESAIGYGEQALWRYYQPSVAILSKMAWHLMQQRSLEMVPNTVLDETSQAKAVAIALKGLGFLQPVGAQRHDEWDSKKHYYFVHLTLQEYFAARYWVGLFRNPKEKEAALEVLKDRRYDQRFEVMWRFAAGLLALEGTDLELTLFFESFLSFPEEMIGLPKQLFIIRCLGESHSSVAPGLRSQLVKSLATWLDSRRVEIGYDYFTQTLSQYPRVVEEIQPQLVSLLKAKAIQSKTLACRLIGSLASSLHHPGELIEDLLTALGDKHQDSGVRFSAAEALGKLGATLSGDAQVQVIQGLVPWLSDKHQYSYVRGRAAEALGKLGGQLSGDAQVQVIQGLLNALGDKHQDSGVRFSAAEALEKLGEKLSGDAQVQVIKGLLTALGDQHSRVRRSAAEALGKLGGQLSGDLQVQVIQGLLTALGDQNDGVRSCAAQALFTLTRQSTLIYKDSLENVQSVATPPTVSPSSLPTSALKVEEFSEVVLGQLEQALETRLTEEVWWSWQDAHGELWQTHRSKLQATLNEHLAAYQDQLSDLISSDLEEQCAHCIVNRLMEVNKRVDVPDKLSRFKLEKSKVRQGLNDFHQVHANRSAQEGISGSSVDVGEASSPSEQINQVLLPAPQALEPDDRDSLIDVKPVGDRQGLWANEGHEFALQRSPSVSDSESVDPLEAETSEVERATHLAIGRSDTLGFWRGRATSDTESSSESEQEQARANEREALPGMRHR